MRPAPVRAAVVFLLCAVAAPSFAQQPDNAATPPPPAPASAPAAGQQPPSIGSLFTELPRASRNMVTARWLAAFAAAGGGAALLGIKDRAITQEAGESRRMSDNLVAGNVIGDTPMQGSIALGTYALGRLLHHPTMSAVGADLVQAQILGGVVADVTKVIAQRQRPNGMNYSFPSGHTTAAFATATVLTRYFGWKIGVPAYLVGAYVATSRVVDQRHYPSDLMIGAMVGIASARAVTIGHGSTRFAPVPIVAHGGAGIGLTLVQ